MSPTADWRIHIAIGKMYQQHHLNANEDEKNLDCRTNSMTLLILYVSNTTNQNGVFQMWTQKSERKKGIPLALYSFIRRVTCRFPFSALSVSCCEYRCNVSLIAQHEGKITMSRCR